MAFLDIFTAACRAGGPPTSVTLFIPCGSNLIILDFTMLAATVYSPKPSVPENILYYYSGGIWAKRNKKSGLLAPIHRRCNAVKD
jgi:hypothetical protein